MSCWVVRCHALVHAPWPSMARINPGSCHGRGVPGQHGHPLGRTGLAWSMGSAGPQHGFFFCIGPAQFTPLP